MLPPQISKKATGSAKTNSTGPVSTSRSIISTPAHTRQELIPRQAQDRVEDLEEGGRVQVRAKVAGIAAVGRHANGAPVRVGILPRAHAAGVEVAAADDRKGNDQPAPIRSGDDQRPPDGGTRCS